MVKKNEKIYVKPFNCLFTDTNYDIIEPDQVLKIYNANFLQNGFNKIYTINQIRNSNLYVELANTGYITPVDWIDKNRRI